MGKVIIRLRLKGEWWGEEKGEENGKQTRRFGCDESIPVWSRASPAGGVFSKKKKKTCCFALVQSLFTIFLKREEALCPSVCPSVRFSGWLEPVEGEVADSEKRLS